MAKTIAIQVCILICILCQSCSGGEENDCAKSTFKALSYPPGQKKWFDSLGTVKNITCVINIGASNIFRLTAGRNVDDWVLFIKDSCLYYTAPSSKAIYVSDFYGYYFYFLFNTSDGKKIPHLSLILEKNPVSITTGREVLIDFDSTAKPSLSNHFKLDSTINGNGFAPAYTTQLGESFTNVYFFVGDTSLDINRFCVSQYFGLLEFTTNKGVTWTFDYK